MLTSELYDAQGTLLSSDPISGTAQDLISRFSVAKTLPEMTVAPSPSPATSAAANEGDGGSEIKPWYKKPVIWGIGGGAALAIGIGAFLILRR